MIAFHGRRGGTQPARSRDPASQDFKKTPPPTPDRFDTEIHLCLKGPDVIRNCHERPNSERTTRQGTVIVKIELYIINSEVPTQLRTILFPTIN